VNSLVAAGAGFLLAVLWFDLMFDVQALRGRAAPLPEAVLSSIAGYYRRVTTTARPMDRLIALVMLVTLAAIIVEIVRGDVSAWVGWTSLVLAAAPITLAATRTLPNAVQLGAREDTVDRQSALARSVGHDHLLCLASIAALLVLQVTAT
jgi:ER membrane protein SH3